MSTFLASKQDRKCPGFTLVELLTVIVVVAILAVIIIPILQSVRIQTLEIKSVSNLRQVGTTYLIVSQERNGELLRYYDGLSWKVVVNNYLNGDPAYKPFAHGQSQWSDAFFDPAGVAREVVHPKQGNHFAPLAKITQKSGDMISPFRFFYRHPHPQRQILLADNGAGPAPDFESHGDLYRVDGGQSWEGDQSGKVSTRGDTPIDPGDSEPGNIRWFEGTAKFFFLDGHVEKRHQSEVYRYNLNPLYP